MYKKKEESMDKKKILKKKWMHIYIQLLGSWFHADLALKKERSP